MKSLSGSCIISAESTKFQNPDEPALPTQRRRRQTSAVLFSLMQNFPSEASAHTKIARVAQHEVALFGEMNHSRKLQPPQLA